MKWNQIESESDSRSASNLLLLMVPNFSSGSHTEVSNSGTLGFMYTPIFYSPLVMYLQVGSEKNGRVEDEQDRLGWVP